MNQHVPKKAESRRVVIARIPPADATRAASRRRGPQVALVVGQDEHNGLLLVRVWQYQKLTLRWARAVHVVPVENVLRDATPREAALGFPVT